MGFNMYYTSTQKNNNNIMVISQVSRDGAVKTEQALQWVFSWIFFFFFFIFYHKNEDV